MNYRDTPEYKGQKRELKPEAKKILAKVALFLAIAGTVFGASQTEGGKKFLGATEAIHSGEISPDLVDIVNGGTSDISFSLDNFEQDPNDPNVMTYDNGAKVQEIVRHTVEDGESIVIKSGAALRREPVVGTVNNHVIATMAKANQDINLTDVTEYSIISNPDNEKEDQFMMIELSSLPVELQKEMNFGPDVKEIYIKLNADHSEAVIENTAETSNTEVAASVSK